MNHLLNLSIILTVALLLPGARQAQSGVDAPKHFERGSVAFDYPAKWTLTESSGPGLETITVSPEPGATQIVVVLSYGSGSACDFEDERNKIMTALAKRLTTVIQAGDAPAGSPVKAKLETTEVEGMQLHGLIDGKPALGDVFFARVNRQCVSLAYVRRADDEGAASAWETLRTSLKIGPPVQGQWTNPPTRDSATMIKGGVLNGRAISLPRPSYPPITRSSHAGGTVVVQVTIDEDGSIIDAHAVSGHPLLQSASVASAKQAKFSPTKLCGEPVEVTGVITYSFVPQ
jgi:TonB family protein